MKESPTLETPRKNLEVGPFPVEQLSRFPFFYEEVASAKAEDGTMIRIGRHMGNQCLYVFGKDQPTLVMPLRPLYQALIALRWGRGD